MECPLYFIIPIRHHATVRDWSVVLRNLEQTLASVSAQTVPGWECRLVASHGAPLPDLPRGCVVRWVDLPPPNLPDPANGIETYYDAFRQEKGRRVYEGIRDLPPEACVMAVDYDDFISNRLAAFVARNPDAPGWYIPQGYLYSGGGWLYRTKTLHHSSGTSHIIRRRVLGSFETPDGALDVAATKRRLGSHIFNLPDLAGTPDALAPLPFAGTVYRIGTPGAAGGDKGGIFHTMTPPSHFLHHPLNTLRRLARYRPLTARLRAEFSLP